MPPPELQSTSPQFICTGVTGVCSIRTSLTSWICNEKQRAVILFWQSWTEAVDKLLRVCPQLLKLGKWKKKKKERGNVVESGAFDALLKDRQNDSTNEKIVHREGWITIRTVTQVSTDSAMRTKSNKEWINRQNSMSLWLNADRKVWVKNVNLKFTF